jgi:hypothetical protein
MENVVVPLIVAGAVAAVPPVRRRAVAMGKASWRGGRLLAMTTVAVATGVVHAAVEGERRPPA